MAEEIWGIVIVSAVSIISVVISQFLTFRSTKNQMIFQTRAAYIQEEYRDLLKVHNLVNKIRLGVGKEESIQTIRKMIDDRPHNFPYRFMVNWNLLEDKIRGTDNKKELKMLTETLKGLELIYISKYHKEVLGMSNKEFNAYIEALKTEPQHPESS